MEDQVPLRCPTFLPTLHAAEHARPSRIAPPADTGLRAHVCGGSARCKTWCPPFPPPPSPPSSDHAPGPARTNRRLLTASPAQQRCSSRCFGEGCCAGRLPAELLPDGIGAGAVAALFFCPDTTRAHMEATPSEQLLVEDGRRRQKRSGRRSAGSAAYAMQCRDADGYLFCLRSNGRAHEKAASCKESRRAWLSGRVCASVSGGTKYGAARTRERAGTALSGAPPTSHQHTLLQSCSAVMSRANPSLVG